METVPKTAPATIIAALRVLGQATPSRISLWFKETYEGKETPTDEAIRQAARRMVADCRVVAIDEEHGLYRLPSDAEKLAFKEAREAQKKRPSPQTSHSSLTDHPKDRPAGSMLAFREQMGREADEHDAAHPPGAGLAEIGRHASYTVLNPDGTVQFRVSYLIEATPGVEVGAFGGLS